MTVNGVGNVAQYICFDIGGTSVKYGIVTGKGKVLAKGSFPTIDDSEKIVADMVQVVNDLRNPGPVLGIGVAAPGLIKTDGYMVLGGSIQSFDGFPLGERLHDATGLPVAIENDGNAAVIAEHWIGAARGIDNYVMVVLGTGVGGGIVINGQLYRGAHGLAGEFDWSIIHNVELTAPLEDQSVNQNVAVVDGLVRKYNESNQQVAPNEPEVTDPRTIMALAESGDAIAAPIMASYYQDAAILIINLFAYLDPELILIGGGISADKRFIRELLRHVDEYLTRHESMNEVKDFALGRVKVAQLRNDAGLIGAAYGIKNKLRAASAQTVRKAAL